MATKFSPRKKIHVLIIDPQGDFCERKGALFVDGADEDMKVRAPRMIKRVCKAIEDIHVTLDSHHPIHVAHPICWVGRDGKHPGPFTIITEQDVQGGVWRAFNPALQKRFEMYVSELARGGRYVLCIWPPHCLIGHPGHNVVPELLEALDEWENGEFAVVDYVTKGSNPYTEHYSALKADVPDPLDLSTQLNTRLIGDLVDDEISEIAVLGEARSHCVANTLDDLVANFGPESIAKLTIITDCCSDVGGPNAAMFKQMGDSWLDRMVKLGAKTSTSTDWLS